MKYDRDILWRALIGFKDRLYLLKTPKNGRIIDYIQSLNYYDDENFKPPTPDEISKSTGVPRLKVLEMLRTLYPKVIETLDENELVISKTTQRLWIQLPWDEMRERELSGKATVAYLSGLSVIINCQLPVIPRVGDTISLPFVDGRYKFNHGYVYNIVHGIQANEQVITIFVHPRENIYKQWKRLEEDYNAEKEREQYIETAVRNKTNLPDT